MPTVKAETGRVTILGIAGASLALLANYPTLTPQFIVGLRGNFVGEKIIRWRNAQKEQHTELTAADIQNAEFESILRELDLADLLQEINAKIDGISGQFGRVSASGVVTAGRADECVIHELSAASGTMTECRCFYLDLIYPRIAAWPTGLPPTKQLKSAAITFTTFAS